MKKKASRSGREYYKLPDSPERDTTDVVEKKESKEGPIAVLRRKSISHSHAPLASVSSSESLPSLGPKKSLAEQRIHEYVFPFSLVN